MRLWNQVLCGPAAAVGDDGGVWTWGLGSEQEIEVRSCWCRKWFETR